MSHLELPGFPGSRGGWDGKAGEAGRRREAAGRTSGVSSEPGTSGVPCLSLSLVSFSEGTPILLFSLLCFSLQVELSWVIMGHCWLPLQWGFFSLHSHLDVSSRGQGVGAGPLGPRAWGCTGVEGQRGTNGEMKSVPHSRLKSTSEERPTVTLSQGPVGEPRLGSPCLSPHSECLGTVSGRE